MSRGTGRPHRRCRRCDLWSAPQWGGADSRNFARCRMRSFRLPPETKHLALALHFRLKPAHTQVYRLYRCEKTSLTVGILLDSVHFRGPLQPGPRSAQRQTSTQHSDVMPSLAAQSNAARARVYGRCQGGSNEPTSPVKPLAVQKTRNTKHKPCRGPFFWRNRVFLIRKTRHARKGCASEVTT